MYDVNDICGMENRRQEVAVRAGVSLRAVKAEPSIFKEMQVKFFEQIAPEVMKEFGEKLQTTKFPGYNFGATLQDVADLSPEAQHTEEEIAAELDRLAAESVANELSVTRTGTGQPKVDESGNVVPPVQSETPEADATKKTPPVAKAPVVVVKDTDKKS